MRIQTKSMLSLFAGAILGLTSLSASAVTLTYTDRATLDSQLGSSVYDDYSNAAYFTGDKTDTTTLDIHTNANMSNILGETQYTTTYFDNHNIIYSQSGGTNGRYCAGCNGSFELDFTNTSVGTALGVYGLGFDFFNISADVSYYATVTFGDNSVVDYALAVTSTDLFWGITSDQSISSIHFGLANGGTTNQGSFSIDNLVIGSSANVPEPATALLLLIGLAGFSLRKKA